MAFSADQIIQELSRILEENGVANPDDIIQSFNSSGLLNDPYGGAEQAVAIKATDFYETFRNANIPTATETADLRNSNLIFYPEVRNDQIVGFKTWMAMSPQGAQNRDSQIITSKLADFSVNVTPDYTGIVHRGLGGAMVEGVSYDTNTGSATVQMGTSRVNREMIDNIMTNLNENSSYNSWLAGNPDQIKLGSNGLADAPSSIRYDALNLPKNYESNRPLQLQSTLKFMDQNTGYLTQEMINSNTTGLKFFSDFQTKDNAKIADSVLETLDQSTATMNRVVEVFGQVYEKKITSGLGSLTGLKHFKGNTMKQKEILNRISSGQDLFSQNFDKNILTSTVNSYFGMLNSSGGKYDQSEMKRRIINDLGLNNYVQEYKTKLLGKSGIDSSTVFNSSEIKNQVNYLAREFGNFSYSTFSIASQQRESLVNGSSLNNILGTNMFMDQDYSLNGIINDVNSGNFKSFNGPIDTNAIRQLQNRFEVVDGKTMFSTTSIQNNQLVTNRFKTTFSGMDMHRVAESNFKSRGLDIASSLMDQGYDSSGVGNIMSTMNAAISNQNVQAFQNIMGELNTTTAARFSEAFIAGQALNISTLVGKDKFKGETSMLGYGSFGGLSLLDKQGLRPKQSRETLQEAIISANIDGTIRNYNASKVISGIYSSIDSGGLVRNDFFRNENARDINRMENHSRSMVENKMKSIDIDTRNNVTAMVGNIIGIYDTDMDPNSKKFIQERLIGFNESTFTSRSLANSLRSERRNNFNVSFAKIEEMLRASNVDDVDGAIARIKSSSGTKLFDTLKDLNLISGSAYNRADDVNYLKGLGVLNEAGFFQKGKLDFSTKTQGILRDYMGVNEDDIQSFFGGGAYGKRMSLLNKSFGAKHGEGILSGIKFAKSFTLDNATIGADGIGFGYYDFSEASVGTKIHSGTGYKATLSGIQDKITVSDINGKNVGRAMELGMITSTKASKRGWVGSQITSFLGAALYQSEMQGMSGDLINALQSAQFGSETNLLNILGLNVSGDLSSFRDSNVTKFTGDPQADIAKIRNIVSNPTLDTMQGSRDLRKRFQNAGISDPESVIHLINKIYEDTMGKTQTPYQKLIGRKKVNISGNEVEALVSLGLESIAITGSDQTFATGGALKIGRMESRFLDDHGLGMVGTAMRKNIASRANSYLSQAVSPGQYAISSLKDPKNAMAYRQAFMDSLSDSNTIVLDAEQILGDKELMRAVSNQDLSFGDLLAGVNKDARENVLRNIQKGDFSTASTTDYELMSEMGGAFRKDYDEYARLIANDGDQTRIRSLRQSLTDAVKKKTFASGIANAFDPKGVIANAVASASDGLGRVLPNIVIKGESLDHFNSSVSKSLSQNSLDDFFRGNSKFQSAYADYATLIREGKDLTGNIATARRKSLIQHLDSYKDGSSVIKSFLTQLTKTKDLDVASNLMLLTEQGARGAAINKRAAYGGFFQDPSGTDFMNPLLRSFEGIKGLDEFSRYSSTFEKIQDRISKGGSNVDIKDLLTDSGFFDRKVADYGDFDNAIVKMLGMSTSSLADTVNYANNRLHSGSVVTDVDRGTLQKAITKMSQEERIIIGSSQRMNVSNVLSSAGRRMGSSLFNMIYGVDTKVQEELTKKGSIFTDNIKYAVQDSISGQFAEGSSILTKIADEFVEQAAQSGSYTDTKAYRDLSDIFGSDVVDNMMLKGTSKYDVTKIRDFKNQIASIENMTLVNSAGVGRRSGDVLQSWRGSASSHFGAKNKGFLGMLARFPLQSSEHMNTTLNFLIDFDKKDNFLVDYLKSSGFNTANSGVVLGKRTALRFGGDFDGDKFYLATLDKAFGGDSGQLDEFIKKGSIRMLGSSGLLGNESAMDAFGIDATARSTYAKEIDYSSKYYSHMNAVVDLKLAKELGGHDDVRHILYQGGTELNDKYMRYGQLNNKKGWSGSEFYDLEKELVSEYKNLTGESSDLSVVKKLRSAIGYFGGSFYDPASDAKKAMSDANIDKAGDVYYQVNNLRNLEQIFSQGNVNKNSLRRMYNAAAVRNNIDVDVFNQTEAIEDVVKYVSSEYGVDNTEDAVADFIRKQQRKVQGSIFASGNLYNEAIELGVISSKNASEAIYSQLGQISQELFSNSSNQQLQKYEEFTQFYMDNRMKLNDMVDEGSELGVQLASKIDNLGDTSNLGDAFNKIMGTYGGERGTSLKARALYAMEVSSAITNLGSVSTFGNILGKIDEAVGGGRGNQTNLQYIQELMGIENTQFTRKGRGTGVYETAKAGMRSIIDKGKDAFISEDEKVRMVAGSMEEDLVRKAKAMGLDADELSDTIQETVGSKEAKATKGAASRSSKAASTTGEFFDNLMAKNKKLKLLGGAAGILALGSFLGYNKGRSNITTYDEENYNEELGFGNPESSFDYTLPSNLGYYN